MQLVIAPCRQISRINTYNLKHSFAHADVDAKYSYKMMQQQS